jgi:hypothetical protein
VFSWFAVFLGITGICACAMAQPGDDATVLPVAPLNSERIAGVIPDFQTVRDSSVPVPPLSATQKWNLAWKESADPFNIANAAMTAGFAQIGNETPRYGEGGMAYGERFGAAIADFSVQNVLSAGVFANLFHQDPRYFRKGPASGLLTRVGYSVSRLALTRQDNGKIAFNASNIFGMILGIAASNAYYPSASRTGSVMVGRLGTSLMGGAVGDLMSEFWPDVQKKLFHHKRAR